jgi:hypothetical protein
MGFMLHSLVVGLVIAVGILACGPGTPPHVSIDPAMATLVPPDTIGLMGMRLDHLRETPFYEKHVETGGLPALNELVERTGTSPDDIWEILAAHNGSSAVVMLRGKFSESGMEPRLEWEGATRGSYKGYLMVSDENAAVTFMNSTTAVAGPPERVKEVIDLRSDSAGPPEALLELANTIDRSNQIWAVSIGGFAPSASPQQGVMANLDRVLRSIRNLKAMGNFSDGLIFHSVGECDNPEDAEMLESTLKAMLGLARFGTRDRPAFLALLDKVAIGRLEQRVELDFNISADLLDQLIAETFAGAGR